MTAVDPTLGSPAEIRAAAKLHEKRSSTVTSQRSALARTIGGITDAEWTGAARASFGSTADSIEPSFGRIGSLLDSVAETLRTYADQVQAIQDEAARIRSAQASAADERERLSTKRTRLTKLVASDDAVESDTVSLRHTQNDLAALTTTDTQLASAWDALVQRRSQLDSSTADALSASDAVGIVSVSASDLSSMTDAQLLAWLGKLGPDQIAALAGDEDVADRLAGMTDPKAVAAWWDGLGGEYGKGSKADHSAAQDALIAAFPAVIGNLNGVAYWARDKANRLSLKDALVKAERDIDRAVAARNSIHFPESTLAADAAIAEARKRYSQLHNFDIARKKKSLLDPPGVVQVVSFTDGDPPLGAISMGNLDTAKTATYLVPGMATSLGDSTVLQRAANNLRSTQYDFTAGTKAVVSWIGYDTPADGWSTGSTDVFRDSKARTGAALLSADLEGYRATSTTGTTLNVVGHSYGTTTASMSLAASPELHVDSFVALGSAGIPRSVQDAAATHAAHVYAGIGDEHTAEFGTFVGHRRSPLSPSFGAEHLETGPSGGLNGVNEHGLLVNDQQDEKKKNLWGYLDNDTSSLSNTAKATAG